MHDQPRELPRVRVEWSSRISPTQRSDLEQQYGLTEGVAGSSGRERNVWTYGLLDDSRENLTEALGRIRAFVDGVTAAATGAIAGAAFVLGRRAIVDAGSLAIALAAFAVAWRLRKVPEPLMIAAAGIVGVFLKGVG